MTRRSSALRWALQSAEWLADAIAPALLGAEPLAQGLQRYRRRRSRGLHGHAAFIHDYAHGSPFKPAERLIISTVARDERVAQTFEALATPNITPRQMLASALPRAMMVNARESIARRVSGHSQRTDFESI